MFELGWNKDGDAARGPQPGKVAEAVTHRKMEFLRYVLDGATLKIASGLVGINHNVALQWMKEPEMRTALKEMSKDLLDHLDMEVVRSLRSKTEAIEECAWLALDRMKDMLEDKNTQPSIVAKLIDSALDRTPEVSRSKKLDVTSKTLTLSGEDMMNALQSMKEIQERDAKRESK